MKTEMINACVPYLNTLHNWESLVQTIIPLETGCGLIYELSNPINRSNESFAIADMRALKISSPHYHTNGETEIYIVLQGSGLVVVGGKELEVQKNSIIVTPPDTAHFTVPTNDLVLAVINTPAFKLENSVNVTQTNLDVGFDQEQFARLGKL